jgi:hypothetical protein
MSKKKKKFNILYISFYFEKKIKEVEKKGKRRKEEGEKMR